MAYEGEASLGEIVDALDEIKTSLARLVSTAADGVKTITAAMQQASGGEIPGAPPAANPESTGGGEGNAGGAASASTARGASGGGKKATGGGRVAALKKSAAYAFGKGLETVANPFASQARAALDIEADATTAIASAFGGDRFGEALGALTRAGRRGVGGRAMDDFVLDSALSDTQAQAARFSRLGISAPQEFYEGVARANIARAEREGAELEKATRATDAAIGADVGGGAAAAQKALGALDKIQGLLQRIADTAGGGDGSTFSTSPRGG